MNSSPMIRHWQYHRLQGVPRPAGAARKPGGLNLLREGPLSQEPAETGGVQNKVRADTLLRIGYNGKNTKKTEEQTVPSKRHRQG